MSERHTRDEKHTPARPSPPHNFTRDNSSTPRQITFDNIQYFDLPSHFSDQTLCTVSLPGCTVLPCYYSACLTDTKQPQPRHQVALYHHRINSFFHQPANNQTIKTKPFIWSAVPETVPSEQNTSAFETCPAKNRLAVKRLLDEPDFGQPSQLLAAKSIPALSRRPRAVPPCLYVSGVARGYPNTQNTFLRGCHGRDNTI